MQAAPAVPPRWSEPGPKEVAIKARFDLSTTRYYAILNELLDLAGAMDYDPLVIRRLRRQRDRRRRARYEGRRAEDAQARTEAIMRAADCRASDIGE